MSTQQVLSMQQVQDKQRTFGKRMAVMGLAGLLMVACAVAPVRAQFPTPEITKEHKLLKRDVGVWDAVTKMWMAGPDSEPMVSKGVERNRMLGGLWLIGSFTCDIDGQEFRGHGLTGYDPQKKKFVGTWVDNMTSTISKLEGTHDESKDELTMFMTGIDPASGKAIKMKMVSKHTGDDTRLFTTYSQTPDSGDSWVKSMEISYTRSAQQPRGQNKSR